MAGTRKLTRRQDGAADNTPRGRLEAFMRKHAQMDADIDHHLILINEAIGRFEQPLIVLDSLSDSHEF
jgi:hypothetical protein